LYTNIVSQLNFSPQAASQLVYYARRLGHEGITRRFSFIAMALVVAFQFAAILVPPASSNAASSSDVIFGGLDQKAPVKDLLRIYDQNHDSAGHTGYQQLFDRFHITRAELAAAHKDTISFANKSIFYLGRNRHDSADQKIVVAGETYYLRHPYAADDSKHTVLAGRRADGTYFSIDIDCGNIIIKEFFAAPPPPPVPVAAFACTNLTISRVKDLNYALTATSSTKNTAVTAYLFDFGDTQTASLPSTAASIATTHAFAKAGTYTVRVRVQTSAGTSNYAAICTVPLKVDKTTPPPVPVPPAPPVVAGESKLVQAKSAMNTTQGKDATGDKITYTLITQNTGTATAPAYVVTEELNDILEYANITDLGGGILNQSDGNLTWAARDLAAGSTVTNRFTVTVKDPIPDTAVSSSDPYSFDLRMDNTYGNTLQIPLAKTLPKTIEAANASLPATGPGLSSLVTLTLFFLITYFYARNRQLAREVRILRVDHNQGV
jgi:hypothetical protein